MNQIGGSVGQLVNKQKALEPELMSLLERLEYICKPPQPIDYSFIENKGHQIIELVRQFSVSEEAMKNLVAPEITKMWVTFISDSTTVYNLSCVNKYFFNLLHKTQFVKDMCFAQFGRKVCVDFFSSPGFPNSM